MLGDGLHKSGCLFNCPYGSIPINIFTRVVGEQTDAFDSIQRPTQVGWQDARFHQMQAERGD